MENTSYNRSTHYTKSDKKQEERPFLSLRSMASEIYPNLNEDRAYRKTLSNFKEACILLKKDPLDYKKGREFQIAKDEKTAFMFLMRNIAIYQTGLPFQKQDYDKITAFAEDMLNTKQALDKTLMMDQIINIDDIANFAEIFYTSTDLQPILLHQIKIQAIQELEKNFQYIATSAPKDRVIMYAEHYQSQLKQAVKSIQVMIEEKWSEETISK